MFALKWSSFIFLAALALLGLPIRAESESTSEEIKPSSAKECRVHIEKALEQYWDQKEPSDTQISGSEQNTNEQNEEDLEENVLESEHNDEQELESFEDEEEVEETDEDETSNEYNKNDNSHDDDDDDEEEEDEKEADGTKVDENEEEEDDDEESEYELESLKRSAKEEVETKSDVTTTSIKDTEEDDDLEDDYDVDAVVNEADDETETELTSEKQDQTSQSDGNDKQNDAEYSESREVEDEADEEEENGEETNGEEDEDDREETDEDNEGETNNDDEEETHEESTEEDINVETENEEISSNENVGDNLQSDISPDEIQIEIQIESDKVTGEADRASARMAPEFLEEKPSSQQSQATQVEEKKLNIEDGDQDESGRDDSIENIYEEEEDATTGVTYRSRDHIDVILEMDEIGTEYDKEEEKIAQNIFKEIKKIHQTQIKPMEMLYKYADSTTRILGDAEIFNKPMLIFLGPWSAGKTSIINYLLGIERTPAALKTGTGITDIDFTLITYGEQNRVISGTELAADWRYAGVQKFGQGFLDHFRCIQRQHTLLKKITIVDTPGVLENRKNAERGYSLNDAFQWFVDRSDAIYVVLDPTKVDIGGELGSVLDQLKGRDARFILNKADSIRRSDLMRVVGQLFWNLSPLMSSTEAPVIYAVSLTTKPYHPSAPAKFLTDQEKNFLYDMKDTFEKRVENRILYARRHAVRVRNHAKMVDCYLATYYRHKSIFNSKRNVAKLITENPRDYNIFDGLGGMTNVSRYDLPDPIAYKEFFKLHPLYDFKPLASTCSYFRGCPMEKLDLAISKDIPELLAKYKKMKLTDSLKQGR